ncbi:hypothetical protein [Streptomyces sp. NPDC088794]|uniref:hypothetical protein n=1 Tax=Streptomyces sp. NPDC088794 TaxID=3365902 RepID=UPI003828E6D9
MADITLWPLGGVARLCSEAPSPGAELRIAGVGPLVGLVLRALFGALSGLFGGLYGPELLVEAPAWPAGINIAHGRCGAVASCPRQGTVATWLLLVGHEPADASRLLGDVDVDQRALGKTCRSQDRRSERIVRRTGGLAGGDGLSRRMGSARSPTTTSRPNDRTSFHLRVWCPWPHVPSRIPVMGAGDGVMAQAATVPTVSAVARFVTAGPWSR